MKIFKSWIIILLLFSVFGVIASVGLLLELGRHDPYSWVNPPFEAIDSRNLWNERKDFYLILFESFLISTGVLFLLAAIKYFARRGRGLK
jgi:hypothetical protein